MRENVSPSVVRHAVADRVAYVYAPLRCVAKRFPPRRIPLHGCAVRTGVKRFSAIWDAACRVKRGRIGPCRRRRWEPFHTPCVCTGVMFVFIAHAMVSMLFPTELGGGNNSCNRRDMSRRFMRHGVPPLALSFPARRNDAGGGNFRNPKRGVPRVFRKFPTAPLCIMGSRWKTILCRCV